MDLSSLFDPPLLLSGGGSGVDGLRGLTNLSRGEMSTVRS